ncbi:MAG: hypothetical protein ACE5JX_04390 [Acidobacteriota bacterium]
MSASHWGQEGFVLPTALLLVMLISAIALGLTLVVNTEGMVAGTDLENTRAYYGAEAAMEKMVVDVNRLYVENLAPTVAQIEALAANPPELPKVDFSQYSITVEGTVDGFTVAENRLISAGPYEGMSAQIVPMTLTATARAVFGNEVRMSRDIEVALIPVFQFGIFSETDLSYFPGPNFNFGGRVHTNGNLFLATSAELKFSSKLTAAGEIIRAELANGIGTVEGGRTGPVLIPTASGGCDGGQTACRDLGEDEGSRMGGPAAIPNPNWANLSTSTYNGMILNGETGARVLELPFVTEGAKPVDLIRRPPSDEDPTSLLSKSRYYNRAQIRILLSDDPVELPDDAVRLVNLFPYVLLAGPSDRATLCHVGGTTPRTIVVGSDFVASHLGHGDTIGSCPDDEGGAFSEIRATTALAEGDDHVDSDFVRPAGTVEGERWSLIDGYLLVQARQSAGWANVTAEWLSLGVSRQDPNAILKFQTAKDPFSGSIQFGDPLSFLPINLYDAREGEVRDVSLGSDNSSCAVGGLMSAVELDVANLNLWLNGDLGASGGLVDSASENGYILYFSDRRGMLAGASGQKEGQYGFEDVINPATASGLPDGILADPEDVNGNGLLERQGGANLGDGFGVVGDPTARLDCRGAGKKNRVSGARHALKLVNGSLGNLPTRPDGSGGFTVSSENPVYVQGNYNADSGGFSDPHAAAAIIADAVTLLSNDWEDWQSFDDATYVGGGTRRTASETWYRTAIAAGKNKSWPHPSWTAAQDYGLDGGTHNFLRYLENWSSRALHYRGSLVSLYYSQYAVGIYKCCSTVYRPPVRDYQFDTEFQYPEKLPPGTPRFRDIVNLHFRQILSPE